MTHRVFSRNASSSRAIPIERMIQDVIDDPAMPVAWGSNKSGMQAGEELGYAAKAAVIHQWFFARDCAVAAARAIKVEGAHKQIVNRLLEPFGHISVVCTATEWDNFFALRCHPDADPTMRALAEEMRDAIAGSTPCRPEAGEWREYHLPYFTDEDSGELATRGYDTSEKRFVDTAMMISAARCARVSYLNHDGSSPDIEKDLALAQKLLEARHMSPFEHQAQAWKGDEAAVLWGNLVGWDQYRKMIELLRA